MWNACLAGPPPAYPRRVLPQLGGDMATGKGDDYHALCGRWGATALFIRTSNTMDPARIAASIKEACADLIDLWNGALPSSADHWSAKRIPIKLDDDGTGNAVGSFLRLDGYNVHLVGAGTVAMRQDRYPNKRSELWFQTADLAKRGGVYLGALDRQTQRRLKQQLLAPAWELDGAGRRVVEPKDDTKEKIGRSPDDADSLNLAYYEPPSMLPTPVEPEKPRADRPGHWMGGR